MRSAPITAAVTLVALLVVAPSPSHGVDTAGVADDDAITLTASEVRAAAEEAAAVPPAERLVEYVHSWGCILSTPPFTRILEPCDGPLDLTPADACDGLEPIEPLWRRTRPTPADPWSSWRLAADWSCPQDELPALTAADFRRLPLAPPTLSLQPHHGRVLVNLPLVTMTDPAPQQLVTNLLGYVVEVDATPTRYSWDFGDGSPPLVTTSPGHPYPDHDVAYAYPRAGTYRIMLTVTHSGRYRLAGTTTWLPVVGTATTTVTGPPVTVEPAPAHLVATDCSQRPQPPGC